jgi:hypothetical protein
MGETKEKPMPETNEHQVHELKAWPHPFTSVLDGTKTHEYRRDDRGFKRGDVLVLREWDPDPGEPSDELGNVLARGYTGRQLRARVTYISRGPMWSIPEGYCVMSIRKIDDEEE